jgi:hypothetical protein
MAVVKGWLLNAGCFNQLFKTVLINVVDYTRNKKPLAGLFSKSDPSHKNAIKPML